MYVTSKYLSTFLLTYDNLHWIRTVQANDGNQVFDIAQSMEMCH